ncbi:hypothetical protein EI94DRAFT_1706061 [Lactarius quietus]|nr:hypothetical protein EI94DRAFT_1706061 [Lactarius quietus]
MPQPSNPSPPPLPALPFALQLQPLSFVAWLLPPLDSTAQHCHHLLCILCAHMPHAKRPTESMCPMLRLCFHTPTPCTLNGLWSRHAPHHTFVTPTHHYFSLSCAFFVHLFWLFPPSPNFILFLVSTTGPPKLGYICPPQVRLLLLATKHRQLNNIDTGGQIHGSDDMMAPASLLAARFHQPDRDMAALPAMSTFTLAFTLLSPPLPLPCSLGLPLPQPRQPQHSHHAEDKDKDRSLPVKCCQLDSSSAEDEDYARDTMGLLLASVNVSQLSIVPTLPPVQPMTQCGCLVLWPPHPPPSTPLGHNTKHCQPGSSNDGASVGNIDMAFSGCLGMSPLYGNHSDMADVAFLLEQSLEHEPPSSLSGGETGSWTGATHARQMGVRCPLMGLVPPTGADCDHHRQNVMPMAELSEGMLASLAALEADLQAASLAHMKQEQSDKSTAPMYKRHVDSLPHHTSKGIYFLGIGVYTQEANDGGKMPLCQDSQVRTIKKAKKPDEPKQIESSQALKAAGTSSEAELVQCAVWCLLKFLRTTAHLYCAKILCWSDLFVSEIPMNGKKVLAALADNAKQNQQGHVDEHGALQHCLVELCPVGAIFTTDGYDHLKWVTIMHKENNVEITKSTHAVDALPGAASFNAEKPVESFLPCQREGERVVGAERGRTQKWGSMSVGERASGRVGR